LRSLALVDATLEKGATVVEPVDRARELHESWPELPADLASSELVLDVPDLAVEVAELGDLRLPDRRVETCAGPDPRQAIELLSNALPPLVGAGVTRSRSASSGPGGVNGRTDLPTWPDRPRMRRKNVASEDYSMSLEACVRRRERTPADRLESKVTPRPEERRWSSEIAASSGQSQSAGHPA
jgi:hypothetical protein